MITCAGSDISDTCDHLESLVSVPVQVTLVITCGHLWSLGITCVGSWLIKALLLGHLDMTKGQTSPTQAIDLMLGSGRQMCDQITNLGS